MDEKKKVFRVTIDEGYEGDEESREIYSQVFTEEKLDVHDIVMKLNRGF